MDALFIKATEETPEICFDKEKPEFRVTGKSYMEDASTYYTRVINWLEEYSKSPNKQTTFLFELEYVNTASSKIVHDILEALEKISLEGHDVTVEWHYYEEDEDMLELGQEYEEIYDLPFTFQQIDFGGPRSLFEID